MPDAHHAPLSPYAAGLRCRCPRCGRDRLVSSYLTVAPRCEVCGLGFALIDSGDGPAVLVIPVVGFLVVGAALLTEILHQPPLWLQAAVWLPLTLVLCFVMVRPLEGILVELQYRRRAAEGRLSGG